MRVRVRAALDMEIAWDSNSIVHTLMRVDGLSVRW